MPPKDTKRKSANPAKRKSKTPGPELQPVEGNEYLQELYQGHLEKAEEEKTNLETLLQKSAAEIERLKKELTKQQGTSQGNSPQDKNLAEQLENERKKYEDDIGKIKEKYEKELKGSKDEIEKLKKDHENEIKRLTAGTEKARNQSTENPEVEKLKEQLEKERIRTKDEIEKLKKDYENEIKRLTTEAENSRNQSTENPEAEKLKEQLEKVQKRTEDEIEKIKKDHEKEIKRLTTDTEKSRNQSTDNSEIKALKEQLDNERKKSVDEIEKKKSHEEEIKRLSSELEILKKQSGNALQSLEKKYEEEKSRAEQLANENKELQEDIENRKEQSKNKKQPKNLPAGDIASLRQENETLKNRLSQLAGAKLTEGNPNIADLSDKNRPTNLAEHFSELYDNEWTDALEELTDTESKSEEEGIKILFDIVKDAYAFSSKQATFFYDSVSKGMEGFGLENHNKWPHGLSKQVKDHRKSISVLVAGSLGQAFLKNQKKKYGKATAKYAEACAALCLYMCVQDPAVYFDSDMPKGKFDKDKYRAYTKSGEEYAFLVWPPLFLHKEGPMLGKGIAQGSK
ncbi:calponin homology domain-containing protein DDB_G0272472-like isoform X4 [Crassostrea angulata]|uniref:calponin homology domain-containing protein DDB_G0272472-like isoform X4 n=1 Tax=Magallana angulata TaxID=2784310 RepID=UPI0022B1A462|nr:calponin homology domain-containing protein DDB_G0272472-like isoform X4 [Crassostrea angulata]